MSRQTYQTKNDFNLTLSDGRIAALANGNDEIPLNRSPFCPFSVSARDGVAVPFHPLDAEDDAYRCKELGLSLAARFTAAPDAIEVRCHLVNERGGDRALSFFFSVPVGGRELTWHDDIRRSRRILHDGGFYERSEPATSGSGAISVYPVGAVTGKGSDGRPFGLSIGLDISRPASFRIGYDASLDLFQIRFDVALVPETDRFPASADFSFIVQTFDPAWGFRAAFAAYMGHDPDAFAVRSPSQGIWMPFTAIESVKDWQDFGFAYHEGGDDSHGFGRRNGIQTFHYTEPFTWWLSMDPEVPRTYDEALRLRQEALSEEVAASNPFRHERAKASISSAMEDADGHCALSFHDLPWCNGACWALNPSPEIPGETTGFTVNWNDRVCEKRHGADSLLSGEYVDSVEGYTTPELNFRRDHFHYATTPLSFDSKTFRPGILKGVAVYECVRRMAFDLRKRGKLLFGNGLPYRFCWLLGAFDIMGTETVWLSEDKKAYAPIPDEQMALWRTLSGKKPYLLLQNTDFHAFDHSMVDRYLQRALFYGIYPSMFSVDAASDPYWADASLYERDRDLFKRYIPLVREVGEAGWEPVTRASSDSDDVLVERFGTRYLTLFNGTDRDITSRIRIDLPVGSKIRERLGDTLLEVVGDSGKSVEVRVPPQSARLLDLVP